MSNLEFEQRAEERRHEYDRAMNYYAQERTLSGHAIRFYLDKWANENPFLSMLSEEARRGLLRDAVDGILRGHDEKQ